ncbi:MAG: hypothetical protein SVR94_09655 [Pseudomonadota bacterium]|nr:hypothetical protein [Pseudomonadota bacterium]
MKKIILTITLALLSFWSQAEEASMMLEGGSQALVFDITEVNLEVSDQVKDGCLPRPDSVNASAEAALRRNNFSIVDEGTSFLPPTVRITALGYAPGNYMCVVSFSLVITKFIAAKVPHAAELDESLKMTIAPVQYEIYSTVLTGPKKDMQDRVEREAEKAANEFFIKIERSKDYVRLKWPQLWDIVYGE